MNNVNRGMLDIEAGLFQPLASEFLL
ncbi:uncharacterized protein METZ01_LOCUS15352 [marine metagenome]|uniref:Uncharacterized protein n=1 Tax=marine metagenome TaxID=408172 RepID=A0A381P8G9_9ZZZZ